MDFTKLYVMFLIISFFSTLYISCSFYKNYKKEFFKMLLFCIVFSLIPIMQLIVWYFAFLIYISNKKINKLDQDIKKAYEDFNENTKKFPELSEIFLSNLLTKLELLEVEAKKINSFIDKF